MLAILFITLLIVLFYVWNCFFFSIVSSNFDYDVEKKYPMPKIKNGEDQ